MGPQRTIQNIVSCQLHIFMCIVEEMWWSKCILCKRGGFKRSGWCGSQDDGILLFHMVYPIVGKIIIILLIHNKHRICKGFSNVLKPPPFSSSCNSNHPPTIMIIIHPPYILVQLYPSLPLCTHRTRTGAKTGDVAALEFLQECQE